MPNAEDYLTRALWQSVGAIEKVAEVQAQIERGQA
jgi:hypothetical protein